MGVLLASGVAAAGQTNVQNPVTALATPTLVSPAYNTHFYNYPRTMTLSWKPVSHATGYNVEVQYLNGGTTWVAWKSVTVSGVLSSSFTFSFIGDQPGRWRVTALDSTGAYATSNPSSWWIFTYTTKLPLATPTLVSPANNTAFYNYPRTTTVAWKPVPGATGYSVEVQQYDPGYGRWVSLSSVKISSGSSASYTVSFGAANPGRWRVTALDSTGTWYSSSPSAWRFFTYRV